jgi:FtsZ-binding cell division protein ZapB
LTAMLIVALPAFLELARAARSAEKLFDTLSRELPPTLEAIRLTGIEITNLSDDVSQNVQTAGRVVDQLDQSISGVKQQARHAQITTRSLIAGFKAAWQTFKQPPTAEELSEDAEAIEDPEVPQLNRSSPPLHLSPPASNQTAEEELVPYSQPIAENTANRRLVESEMQQTLDQQRSLE